MVKTYFWTSPVGTIVAPDSRPITTHGVWFRWQCHLQELYSVQ